MCAISVGCTVSVGMRIRCMASGVMKPRLSPFSGARSGSLVGESTSSLTETGRIWKRLFRDGRDRIGRVSALHGEERMNE